MVYGAVVLMVICFTILSLQQLWDANQYRYRFGVLRKLGVEDRSIHHLISKQLALWFGGSGRSDLWGHIRLFLLVDCHRD